MVHLEETLAKLRQQSEKAKVSSVVPATSEEEKSYAIRLDRSLRSLQRQVDERELELQKRSGNPSAVSVNSPPAQDPESRIRQLRAITNAYRSLTDGEPILPAADSPLPALLALREALLEIDRLKRSIIATRERVSEVQAKLRRGNEDLASADEMGAALKTHIEKLEHENTQLLQESTEASVSRMWQAQHQKTEYFTRDFKHLVMAFNKFVNTYLAVMLAAEDLGGPTVGDDLELKEDMLAAGFTKRGKVKKASKKAKGHSDKDSGSDDERSGNKVHAMASKNTAGADFRKLTENLMNAVADEDSADPYIDVEKDSAAVRFLVRARIAQFHPDDARKLRLIDFSHTFTDQD